MLFLFCSKIVLLLIYYCYYFVIIINSSSSILVLVLLYSLIECVPKTTVMTYTMLLNSLIINKGYTLVKGDIHVAYTYFSNNSNLCLIKNN